MPRPTSLAGIQAHRSEQGATTPFVQHLRPPPSDLGTGESYIRKVNVVERLQKKGPARDRIGPLISVHGHRAVLPDD
jgi:hypothetical protein